MLNGGRPPDLRAAKRGDVDAMRHVASNYELGSRGVKRNLNKAVEWYWKLVRLGDRDSMTTLGLMAVESKQYELAAELLKKAARLGDDYALDNLRALAKKGILDPLDPGEDLQLLESSALLGGNPIALRDLGLMYEKGRGNVTVDRVRAYVYLTLASHYEEAQEGLGAASIRVKRLEKKLNSEEHLDAQKLMNETFDAMELQEGMDSGSQKG